MRLLLVNRHRPAASILPRYNLYRALHNIRQKENKQSLSFEELGVDHYVLKGVRRAFPHVETPTPLQSNFIPAVLEGRDVLIKDNTGTGK
jgi:superfamily II DNA/RNA helicase